MNPIRIYFLSSLLMLFVLELKQGTPGFVKMKGQDNRQNESVEEQGTSIEKELSESDLNLKLAKNAEQNIAKPASSSDTIPLAQKNSLKRFVAMMDFYEEHTEQRIESALSDLNLESNLWNKFLYSQAIKASNFDDSEFNKYLFGKLFWVFFLFVPILAVLLRLIYIRQDFYYSEHIFFAFYTQAVFFLIFAIGLTPTFSTVSIPLAIIGFIIYQYLAMYRFYDQRPAKTFLKFFILNGLSTISFGIFFLISAIVVFILK